MAVNEQDYVGFGIDKKTGKRHEINHLPETAEWEKGVYQYEQNDKLIAGPDGIDNLQGQQLANRTAYLKRQLEEQGMKLKEQGAKLEELGENAGSGPAGGGIIDEGSSVEFKLGCDEKGVYIVTPDENEGGPEGS